MNKLYWLTLALLIISCSSEPAISDEELFGTWILSNVEGTCLGLPVNGNGDEIGCIDLPSLEVNCSIIQFKGEGKLSYAYNSVKGEGSYELMENGIKICTDRCLVYSIEDARITLQTGTIDLCDPLYTFTKTSSNLDELVEESQIKRISKVKRNGAAFRDYNYGLDGSLQSILEYDESGNLRTQQVFSHLPLITRRTLNYVQSGVSYMFEYYDEGLDRTRRDRFDSEKELIDYRLYFHTASDCWVERTETYDENDQLYQLYQNEYSGEHCDIETTYYRNGELISKNIYTKDGMSYYASSALLNMLRYKSIGNTTSYTQIKDSEIDINTSYTSIFNYGVGGFPSSETRSYLNGNIELYSFEYE